MQSFSSSLTLSKCEIAPNTKIISRDGKVEITYNPSASLSKPIQPNLLGKAVSENFPVCIIALLLKDGAAFDKETILLDAVKKCGADKFEKVAENRLKITSSLESKLPKLVELIPLLLEHGAKIHPETLSDFLSCTGEDKPGDVVSFLKDLLSKAKVQKAALPHDLLDTALKIGHSSEVVEILLQEGFKITDTTLDMALGMAFKTNFRPYPLEMIERLFQLGAKPTRNTYRYLFEWARCGLYKERPDIIIGVIQRVQKYGGPFPKDILEGASAQGASFEIIEFLIDQIVIPPANINIFIDSLIDANYSPEHLIKVDLLLKKLRLKFSSSAQQYTLLYSALDRSDPSLELVSNIIKHKLGTVSKELLQFACSKPLHQKIIILLLNAPNADISIDHIAILLNRFQGSSKDNIEVLKIIYAKTKIPAEKMLIHYMKQYTVNKDHFEKALLLLKEAGIPVSVPLNDAIATAWKIGDIAAENASLLLELKYISPAPPNGDWRESPLDIMNRLKNNPGYLLSLTKTLLEMKAVPLTGVITSALEHAPGEVIVLLLKNAPETEVCIDHISLILQNVNQRPRSINLEILKIFHAKTKIPAEKILLHYMKEYIVTKESLDFHLQLLKEANIPYSVPLNVAIAPAWKKGDIGSQNAPLLLELKYLSPAPQNGDWRESPLDIMYQLKNWPEELIKLTKTLLEMKAVPVAGVIQSALEHAPREAIVLLLKNAPDKELCLDHCASLLSHLHHNSSQDNIEMLKIFYAKTKIPAEKMLIRYLKTYIPTKAYFEQILQLLNEAGIPVSVPLPEAILPAWEKGGEILSDNSPLLLEFKYISPAPPPDKWRESPLDIIDQLKKRPEDLIKLTKTLLEMKAVPVTGVIKHALTCAPLEVIKCLIESPLAQLNEEILIQTFCVCFTKPQEDILPLLKFISAKMKFSAEKILISLVANHSIKKADFENAIRLLKQLAIPFSVPLPVALVKALKEKIIPDDKVSFLLELGVLAGQWVVRPWKGKMKVPKTTNKIMRQKTTSIKLSFAGDSGVAPPSASLRSQNQFLKGLHQPRKEKSTNPPLATLSSPGSRLCSLQDLDKPTAESKQKTTRTKSSFVSTKEASGFVPPLASLKPKNQFLNDLHKKRKESSSPPASDPRSGLPAAEGEQKTIRPKPSFVSTKEASGFVPPQTSLKPNNHFLNDLHKKRKAKSSNPPLATLSIPGSRLYSLRDLDKPAAESKQKTTYKKSSYIGTHQVSGFESSLTPLKPNNQFLTDLHKKRKQKIFSSFFHALSAPKSRICTLQDLDKRNAERMPKNS